ncbi:MAG: gliding motility-associated C-terminal domain-containing protein [Flavobacteriales bacterium]|jgi:gliding motility-associated-like protein
MSNFYRFLSLLLVCFLHQCLAAQTSDCETASSVCAGLFEQNNSPAGTGNVFEQAPGSCQTFGEFNSAWYVFTVQEDGDLSFILQPNDNADDYDWSLYDITQGGCAGINTGVSPEISCNSYGSFDPEQGPTGISSANGGTGNSNGPGNAAGPPFNADLPVTQGQVLALVVMNFSATLNGYSLEFGNEAEIFDNTPPVVTDVQVNCAQNEVTVTFSESLLLSEFNANEIVVSVEGTFVAVTSIESTGNTYVSEITLVTPDLANETGVAEVLFEAEITDVCGNVLTSDFPVTLEGAMTIEISTGPACNGQGGSIEVEVANAGVSCPTLTINGTAIPSAEAGCGPLLASNLTPGNYNVSVTNNDNGCVITQNNIAVINDNPIVNAGLDFWSCELSSAISINVPAGNFVWTGPAGVSFQDPNSPQTIVSVIAPGTYAITGTLTVGECVATDEVNISFSSPPNLNIEPTALSCFYLCDGAVSFQDDNNPSIEVEIDGVIETGNPVVFENFCAGSYDALVTFTPGCFAFYSFTIESPLAFSADFEYTPNPATVDNSVVTFTALEEIYDSLEFIIPSIEGERFVTNPSIVELPALPGFYNVELVVYSNGCEQRSTLSVRVVDNLVVFIPNSFTPDDDGLNDVFLPIFSTEPELYSLQVFNRWGDKIFETTDWKQPWLGEVNEGEYYGMNDLYFWKMSYKGADIDVVEQEGNVILIR